MISWFAVGVLIGTGSAALGLPLLYVVRGIIKISKRDYVERPYPRVVYQSPALRDALARQYNPCPHPRPVFRPVPAFGRPSVEDNMFDRLYQDHVARVSATPSRVNNTGGTYSLAMKKYRKEVEGKTPYTEVIQSLTKDAETHEMLEQSFDDIAPTCLCTISRDVANVPVYLHKQLYDLNALLKWRETGKKTVHHNNQAYKLSEITPAWDVKKAIEDKIAFWGGSAQNERVCNGINKVF